jgi:hypothetical protein
MPTNSRVLIPQNNIGDMQLQAMSRNNRAMSAFTLAFKTQSLHATISDAMTTNWSKGLASLVLMALLDEYSPSDTAAGVEAAAMLDKVKWKANQSPMKLFEQLATIRNMFLEKVIEEQLITTMMAQAPKEYKTIITMESRSVRARLNREPNIREYKKAMIEHYRTLGGDADLDADGKEVLLDVVDPEDDATTVERKDNMRRTAPNPRKEEASGARETVVERTAGALKMEDSDCGSRGILACFIGIPGHSQADAGSKYLGS